MTVEELEQEADKALDKRMGTICYIGRQDVQIPYTDGYKDGAEPREKRIAELEKENAELKKSVNNWLKYEKETQYHKSIIKDLKKEKAELKEKLDKINDYLANEIPHKLINEATNKIWRLL